MRISSGLRAFALFASLVSSFAVCPAALADSPTAGYEITSAPHPVFGASVATLPGGDLVTWDGLSVDRWAADGTFVGNLTTFAAPVFTSFVTPSPDGSCVAIGESSNGRIYLVRSDGSGRAFLRKLAFNFAAAFAPNGDLIVSAATCGFFCGNDILRVDPMGAVTRLAKVAGFSGPVTVAANGDLYYGTVANPADPGTTDVLLWTASQLAAGQLLDESDATLVGSGLDPAGAIELDPVTGRLYLATNDFGSAVYRIVQVDPASPVAPVLAIADQPIFGMQRIELGGTASLDPYQPTDGQALRYASTSAAASDVVTVTPKRPLLTVSGPGTSGVGAIDFDLAGAVPGGAFTLIWAPQATFDPLEQTYAFPTFLFHTGLALGQLVRLNLPIAVDPLGNARLSIFNSGNLQDRFAWQVLVRDSTDTAIGSSNSVLF